LNLYLSGVTRETCAEYSSVVTAHMSRGGSRNYDKTIRTMAASIGGGWRADAGSRPRGLARSVVIIATSDQPALLGHEHVADPVLGHGERRLARARGHDDQLRIQVPGHLAGRGTGPAEVRQRMAVICSARMP